MTMADGGVPHRRVDDCVSFRDMVEYVADQEAKWHSVRAESLMQIGNAIEKIEKSFNDHAKWHREVLERMLSQGTQNRLATYALILTMVGLIISSIALR